MEELTWHDMMLIHKCIKDAMNYNLDAMSTAEGQQKVYDDVLRRFKEMRKIEENFPKLPKISPKGKTVCAFSTNSYTDEEREILCDDCEEDCKYSPKNKSVSNVLDEELDRFKKLHGPMATLERCAKHFANWQKKKMMKDAVDGEIIGEIRNQEDEPYDIYAESNSLPLDGYVKYGDKVKMIIIKDES